MQKVKLFKSIESELGELEKEINAWLSSHAVKVVSITGNIAAQTGKTMGHMGSFSSSDVFLVVLYEEVG